ncbi:exosortase/archaeosortase family protein [Candidatus Bathyarchaeota archaeon]|nr:exosortase/archaeosortase family protein [Candidatus Bathyarchaeota archaeon]
MKKDIRNVFKMVGYLRVYYQRVFSAILVVAIVFIVYWNDLAIVANEALQNEAFSHFLLIPFFVGFLFYLKRDMVKGILEAENYRKKIKTEYLDELVGLIVCLVAFLIYWYGSYTFYPLEYHLLTLPIFVTGVTLILFNLKVLKALILPILFLLFLIPPPTEFIYTIGGAMANFNTAASYSILKTFGLPVTLSSSYGPPTIELATSSPEPVPFSIGLPCSGIYSFMAFSMFAAFLAFVAATPLIKKVWMFITGFIVFEIMNIIRITAIVSIAHWLGEEVAMVMFHAVAGLMLIFVGMLITLFVADKFLKIQTFPAQHQQVPCLECKTNQASSESFCVHCGRFLNAFRTKISQRFWMKLSLLLLGCTVIMLSIHTPTFAIAQDPVGISSGWENATNVFPSNIVDTQGLNHTLRFLYRDRYFEGLAHQDASLMYAYFPPSTQPSTLIYVDVGVASSIASLHSWEVCLITWRTSQGLYSAVTIVDSRDIQLLEDVSLIARYLVFESPENYTQVTLYWYEKAMFNTGITVEQKYVRISLIILTRESTNYQQFEEKLLIFGREIASYWKPLKNQSLVSLGVPAQQLLLGLSIVSVVSTKAVQYSVDSRKKNNNLKIFKNFAPDKEKAMLETIRDLAKDKRVVETSEIYAAIEKSKGNSVKFDELSDALMRLEEYGFMKRDVISVKNKPKLVWRIHI